MAILGEEPNYDLPAVKKRSDECLNLMKKLLTKSPAERISVKDALEHEFFKQLLSPAELERSLSGEFRETKLSKISTTSPNPNLLNINVEKLKDFNSSRSSNSSL